MQMQVSVPLDSTRCSVDAERSFFRLAVRGFIKVFGPDPPIAPCMLPDCADRDEVHRRLGAAVGVDNASFEVKSGKVVMIMGPSGPVKSTIIRLLDRPLQPTSGGIFLTTVLARMS